MQIYTSPNKPDALPAAQPTASKHGRQEHRSKI